MQSHLPLCDRFWRLGVGDAFSDDEAVLNKSVWLLHEQTRWRLLAPLVPLTCCSGIRPKWMRVCGLRAGTDPQLLHLLHYHIFFVFCEWVRMAWKKKNHFSHKKKTKANIYIQSQNVIIVQRKDSKSKFFKD